jgi:hypothetical protein
VHKLTFGRGKVAKARTLLKCVTQAAPAAASGGGPPLFEAEAVAEVLAAEALAAAALAFGLAVAFVFAAAFLIALWRIASRTRTLLM